MVLKLQHFSSPITYSMKRMAQLLSDPCRTARPLATHQRQLIGSFKPINSSESVQYFLLTCKHVSHSAWENKAYPAALVCPTGLSPALAGIAQSVKLTAYGRDDRSLIPDRGRVFSSSPRPERLWTPTSILPNGERGVKRPECEAHPQPPSSSNVWKVWNLFPHPPTHLYVMGKFTAHWSSLTTLCFAKFNISELGSPNILRFNLTN
jgi:hypothetical protein